MNGIVVEELHRTDRFPTGPLDTTTAERKRQRNVRATLLLAAMKIEAHRAAMRAALPAALPVEFKDYFIERILSAERADRESLQKLRENPVFIAATAPTNPVLVLRDNDTGEETYIGRVTGMVDVSGRTLKDSAERQKLATMFDNRAQYVKVETPDGHSRVIDYDYLRTSGAVLPDLVEHTQGLALPSGTRVAALLGAVPHADAEAIAKQGRTAIVAPTAAIMPFIEEGLHYVAPFDPGAPPQSVASQAYILQ